MKKLSTIGALWGTLLVLSTACTMVDVAPLNESEYRPAVHPHTVEVLETQPEAGTYVELAVIDIEGHSGHNSMTYDDKIERARLEASRIGAEAIIIISAKEGQVSTDGGGSRNTTMTATAIRYY